LIEFSDKTDVSSNSIRKFWTNKIFCQSPWKKTSWIILWRNILHCCL